MDNRRAFTLVELLLVVMILGAVVVVAVPNLDAILGGTQSSSSLRVLMQMGRYTRSMALLNQVPCELVVDLDQRTLTTEMVQTHAIQRPVESDETGYGTGSGFFQESLYESGATATVSFGHATSAKDRDASGRILKRNLPVEEETESDAGDAGDLSESIHMEQKIPGEAPIAFLGYADTVEQKRFRSARASGSGETNGVFRIRYRTNGTCRPYRIAVGLDDDDASAVIEVDSVGTPTVTRKNGDSSNHFRKKW